jgi:hypothetical protein
VECRARATVAKGSVVSHLLNGTFRTQLGGLAYTTATSLYDDQMQMQHGNTLLVTDAILQIVSSAFRHRPRGTGYELISALPMKAADSENSLAISHVAATGPLPAAAAGVSCTDTLGADRKGNAAAKGAYGEMVAAGAFSATAEVFQSALTIMQQTGDIAENAPLQTVAWAQRHRRPVDAEPSGAAQQLPSAMCACTHAVPKESLSHPLSHSKASGEARKGWVNVDGSSDFQYIGHSVGPRTQNVPQHACGPQYLQGELVERALRMLPGEV